MMKVTNSVVQQDMASELMQEKLDELKHDMQVGKKITVDKKDYEIVAMSTGLPYTIDTILKS